MLAIVPAARARTTIVTVAEPAAGSDPSGQESAAVPVQLPWLAAAETKLTPAGSWSVKVTPVAAAGPPFVTVAV